MGTTYGVYCATCREAGPTPFLRGEHIVRSVASHWQALSTILFLSKQLPEEIKATIKVEWYDDGELPEFLAFLFAHHGHEWLMLDEYGHTHERLTTTVPV